MSTLGERRKQGLDILARRSPEIAGLIKTQRVRDQFWMFLKELHVNERMSAGDIATALKIPAGPIEAFLRETPHDRMIDNVLSPKDLEWLDNYMKTGSPFLSASV